jgi:hypothetical protein
MGRITGRLVLVALAFIGPVHAQCIKDTDCKGDRICERGVCVSPTTTGLAQLKPQATSRPTTTPLAVVTNPKFEDFAVPVYSGPLVPPKGVRHVSANEWRNAQGKLIEPMEINFAGRYWMVLNSCGTGCRYYALTDLSSGRNLDVLNAFDAAEPPPTTREGFLYTTDLIGRADSSMLVAQYQVETRDAGTQCRERVFVFEAEKLRPITNTRRGCRSY